MTRGRAPAAAFARNPIYLEPENIVKLVIEAGCDAAASTVGVLSAVARRYADRIPSSPRSTTTRS